MSEFIFDYETLGQNVITCPVVDMSYLVFDREKFVEGEGYKYVDLVKSAKTIKFDVSDQVKRLKYVIEKSTLEWWKSQGEHAKSKLAPQSYDVTIEKGLQTLINDIQSSNIQYWWSRSNTFDPVILMRTALTLNESDRNKLNNKLKYWAIRDTRTWIDAKLNFPRKNGFVPIDDEATWNKYFQAHDSRHDIAADIMRMQKIARIENQLPTI